MKIGIKQISELTGFSPATVSNALSGKRNVSQDTASKIYSIAKSTGYISESSLKKIKLVALRTSGRVFNDSPFFSVLLDGVAQACSVHGFETAFITIDSNAPNFEEQLRRILDDKSAAIILLGTEIIGTEYKLFEQVQVPMVTLDFWHPEMRFNGVEINNHDSAYFATEYLINNGHTKIGYLKGDLRIKGFVFREQGFKDCLASHGIPYNDSFAISLGTTTEQSYVDMLGYLSAGPTLPTAFFADNDMIALGAMKALDEVGYHIPQDISIIGFDDLPYCEISSPRLSSMRVPKQEMGKLAVDRLVEITKTNDHVITRYQVCAEFVERDSVRKIK